MLFNLIAQLPNIPGNNPGPGNTNGSGGDGVLIDLRSQKDQIASQTDFNTTIEGYLRGFLFLAGLVTFFYMLWGAFDWITAGGDEGKIKSARQKITQGVIGLAVLASTFAVFLIIQYFLGLNIVGGGSIGSNGGSSAGNGATTCAGGVAIGAVVSDGGSGGYCTNGGAARVRCTAAGQGSGLNYPHFDPVSCISGQKAWNW
jgi:hypothetical protein